MKKYILTIKYDEDSDTVEWIQEEVIEDDDIIDITQDNVYKLTVEDMQLIKIGKDYAKA
ncbi:MAG: hypothetical protein Unbinned1966contig1000_36 [Prokaryotic dsDNA virus sp.]|nr:MAG: hypothetical protein Unbinned1966contig1000_36 [Prokaryotic dsDNA virus sp.]|tara:strand:+ start:5574 stop:5750 length:177 start_codon:yes stop_codon:yes gene_type:complete